MNKSRHHLFERSVSIEEKINFARHLALIIKAGLPILEGLRIIQRQKLSRALRSAIDQMATDLNNGQFLADSLDRHRHVFGDFFINVIRVGETSGTLHENLLYLADELKKSKILQSKVRSAMIYPVILVVMTVGVTTFLTFYVFPKLLGVFADLGTELPLTTKILIIVLTFFRAYLAYIIVGFILSLIFLRFLLRREEVKYGFDWFLLKIPVLRGLIVDTSVTNFTRIFALLLRSGINIVEALTIVSSTFTNLVYMKSLKHAANEIKRGGSLGQFFAKHTDLYPPILVAMIEVGENTGNLEENLVYLSDYYSDEVDTSLKNLTALIEPMILLFMGLIIAFVALAIITPIYSISESLSK